MSEAPVVKRYGSTWDLVWADLALVMQFDRVRDKGDDVTCMVTIGAERPTFKGRVLGPQRLNLMSATGQQTLARTIGARVAELKESALGLVTTACARVVEDYMAPSPTVWMDEIADEVGSGPPVEYLAPLLPEGETTIAYGDSESAKSLLAQIIGMCVQLGLPLPWSRQVPKRTNVLMCDWETNHRTVYQRMRRLGAGLPNPIQPPHIAYRGMLWKRDVPPLRMLEDELPSLREQIIRDNIGLVVVDSIGFAVRGKLVDDDVARQAMGDLRQLAPATRLVVAHVSKESARVDHGRVDPFGSAFFRAGCRSALEVRRSEEDVRPSHISVGIYHWKANDDVHTAPFGLGIDFEGLNGPISFSPEDLMQTPDLAGRTSLSHRLRSLLRQGASTTTELAAETGAKPETVDRTLQRMPDTIRVIVGGGRGNPNTWGLMG